MYNPAAEYEKYRDTIRKMDEARARLLANKERTHFRCPVCGRTFDVPDGERVACPEGPHEGTGRYPIPYI